MKGSQNTLIFYEAPHKLLSTLRDMLRTLGDRKIALCKELTKLHEQVFRTTLSQAVEHYTKNPPKGEFVLVVEGAAPREEAMTLDGAVALAREILAGGTKPADAARQAAAVSGFKKAEIYKRLIREEER